MKFNLKNTVLALVFLATSFSLWSCKDDTEINPDATMSALLDGTPWNGSSTGLKSGNTITLTGVSTSSLKTIVIAFRAEVGTQVLNASVDTSGVNVVPSVLYSATPSINPATASTSNFCTSNTNAQIVITNIDTTNKTVTGTFKTKVCTLNSSIEITQGIFNKAKYN
jgi:hypothetical protein